VARWLKWFLATFVLVNLCHAVANAPTPFTLLWQFFTKPAPEARTLDGGIHFQNLVMGVAMLLGWVVVALVMRVAMGKKPGPVPPG
jgi:hypothetical protein